MKYVISLVLAFVALFALASAADCEIDGHQFNKGEKYAPAGTCTLATCNGSKQFSAVTCPSQPSQKGCELIPQDNSKTYPDCCPHYKC